MKKRTVMLVFLLLMSIAVTQTFTSEIRSYEPCAEYCAKRKLGGECRRSYSDDPRCESRHLNCHCFKPNVELI